MSVSMSSSSSIISKMQNPPGVFMVIIVISQILFSSNFIKGFVAGINVCLIAYYYGPFPSFGEIIKKHVESFHPQLAPYHIDAKGDINPSLFMDSESENEDNEKVHDE